MTVLLDNFGGPTQNGGLFEPLETPLPIFLTIARTIQA